MNDFAELSLESVAPFPVEQLLWGYLHAEDGDSILIYAAHRDRLKNAGFNELNAYVWALPDFATLAGAVFPQPTQVVLQSDSSIAVLHFKRGTGVPTNVVAAPFTGENCDATIAKLRDSAPDDASGAEPKPRQIHLQRGSVELDDNGIPCFHHISAHDSRSDRDYGKWTPLTLSESKLWRADVRSVAFKQAERRNRRTSARLTQITGWILVAALTLLLAEGALFAAQVWLGTLNTQITSQAPTVARIQDRQILMDRLEQVARNELRPIDALTAANNVRLDQNLRTIEYDSVAIEDENIMTIEGKAGTVNELIRYTEHLNRSGLFEIIGQPRYLTSRGQTTFTITLSYKGNHSPAPPAAQTQPEVTEDQSPEDENEQNEEAVI